MNSDALSPQAGLHLLQTVVPTADLEVYVLQGGFAQFAHLYHQEPDLFSNWDGELWHKIWDSRTSGPPQTSDPEPDAAPEPEEPKPEPEPEAQRSPSFRNKRPKGSFALPPTALRMPPQMLRELVSKEDPGLVVVDVRQKDFRGGHIRGSKNIAFDQYVEQSGIAPPGVCCHAFHYVILGPFCQTLRRLLRSG